MPGCIVSATIASFSSVEKRRLRATPVITSTFENVSDIGIRLGLSLGPPAKAGVRCKRGAVQYAAALVTDSGRNELEGPTIAAVAIGPIWFKTEGTLLKKLRPYKEID